MRGQKGDKGDAWGAVLLEMALPTVYIRVVHASRLLDFCDHAKLFRVIRSGIAEARVFAFLIQY